MPHVDEWLTLWLHIAMTFNGKLNYHSENYYNPLEINTTDVGEVIHRENSIV